MNFVDFLTKQVNIFRKLILITFFVFIGSFAKAGLKNGFKALSVYNYFLAKKEFYKANKRSANPFACYGLALIYSRNDNPFYNLDSASRYASLGYCAFIKGAKSRQLYGFAVDSVSLLALCDSVAFKKWILIRKLNDTAVFNHFLKNNYLANALLKEQAVYLRDEIEYNLILQTNRSELTAEFINTHPQSAFLPQAVLLIQRQIFEELTTGGEAEKYVSFINKHKQNSMLNTAYENLYKIYKDSSDVKGLKNFVNNYPKAPQYLEAWKLLFSLTVKSFSNRELEAFLEAHPAFPLKNSILKELELNKHKLFPIEEDGLFGFIDSLGNVVIKPVYDAVSPFNEGLSVVNLNDSVFYINKENKNPFNQFYAEAYSFKNGIAPVKSANNWMLINRQGQVISEPFEEINELSEDVYVVKINAKYGAIDHAAQTIIEPKFQKLGDFKNHLAYYIEGGKYGFVSKTGLVHKAEFDWLSDFNENKLAIIKQNNLYGLINSAGQTVLTAEYDLVLRAANNNYIVVKNNLYGFYNGAGCFLSALAYDFLKEKPVEFYTNGSLFKLLKNKEQSIVDVNGKQIIDFGLFDEIHFPANGLMRVKRGAKFGFADKKLALFIPFKYQEAQDFADSVAIVTIKDKYALINLQGKDIYTSEEEITKLSKRYYVIGEDKKMIITKRGLVVYPNVSSIQKINSALFVITLSNKEVKLLKD